MQIDTTGGILIDQTKEAVLENYKDKFGAPLRKGPSAKKVQDNIEKSRKQRKGLYVGDIDDAYENFYKNNVSDEQYE